MIRGLKISVVLAFAIAMVFACSTEKNTLINRSYHGLTAHYNGYFNANLLIDQSMQTYRNSVNEDFYSILPIDLVPNEEEVIGMYPAIDTAIAKCTKVIVNHSMPSNDRPARKKSEHNRWIDETLSFSLSEAIRCTLSSYCTVSTATTRLARSLALFRITSALG